MAIHQHLPHALLRFVDDELLRAPLIFDQVIDGTLDHARKNLAQMAPLQRSAVADLMQALLSQRTRLSEYFMRSLHQQVSAELKQPPSRSSSLPLQLDRAAHGMEPRAPRALNLALVDEDVVALDVELSHAIEAINNGAEYELRELAVFISALVGDMDVAADHNPFRAETYARAVWAAAQALALSRGHQVAFMRHAGVALAQVLRKSYAASCSRLEAMGVEPAAHRTLIMPSGSRRGGRIGETTFSPDLQRMRESMPAPLEARAPALAQAAANTPQPLRYDGQAAQAQPQRQPQAQPQQQPQPQQAQSLQPLPALRAEHWSDVARGITSRVDRQAIELVSRLFEAMQADERVPAEVNLLIARLHGPAMRLTLRDGSMLDQDKHPLWRFINLLVFEAQMVPDVADPERVQLLKVAQSTVDQVGAEPEQTSGLYRWALERLETFLQKRLMRRLSAAASQIGALQKLEDKLDRGQAQPSTMHGMLDVPQLDTVPAELLDQTATAARPPTSAEEWLEGLRPGTWVRMFLQGSWTHARLLWPGERGQIWLFGDGASDATWAVHRAALLTMHAERLTKTLKQRSIVGSAAARVHEQMADAAAAAA